MNGSNYNTRHHNTQNYRIRPLLVDSPLASLPIPAIPFLPLSRINPNLHLSPSSSQDGMQATRRTKPNVSNVSNQSITTHYPSAITARARETSNPITHQKTTSHSQLIVSKSDQATIIPFHAAKSTHKESVTIAPVRNHGFNLATSHAQHETRLSKR